MDKLEPILIVPDCHIPYEDRRAFKLMMNVAKDLKPQHIVIIGDFLDFYSVSSHSKDPSRANLLLDEINEGNIGLNQLDALGAKHKWFLGGNHCDRLQRYINDKAPELNGFVSVEQLLRLKPRGWTYVPYKDDMEIGKVNFTHDVGVAGRYAVFACLDTYQHSIITGHTHRMAYIVEGNAKGETKLSAQFGWLGDSKKIDYMQKAKVLKNWSLGFGIAYFNPKTKLVYAVPVPIVNYTCCVNGKLYGVA